MDAGSKSVSHLERLLDKFHWLLEDIAKEPMAKVRLVGAIAAFWESSTQMTWLVIHKMVRYRKGWSKGQIPRGSKQPWLKCGWLAPSLHFGDCRRR
jgi:hypothetical protein